MNVTFRVSRYPSRTLGEKLKKWRLLLGLKQVELADMLRVNQGTVVNWERGQTKPSKWNRPLVDAFIEGRLVQTDSDQRAAESA